MSNSAVPTSSLSSLGKNGQEWFAAHVHAGREQFCAGHLRLRGYNVFLPCYYEHHRWSDRVKKIEKALFPGYVFCFIDAAVGERVVTTPGVIRILGDGRGPLSVPREEIEAIQRVVDAGLHAEPFEFLLAGQRVRIGVGPLRGTEGIVLRMKNRHRLVISVALLQRSVAVEIDPAWVSVPPESLIHAFASSQS